MVGSILEHTTQHGAMEGKTQIKAVKYYNLDAIIAVGYRVSNVIRPYMEAVTQCWCKLSPTVS